MQLCIGLGGEVIQGSHRQSNAEVLAVLKMTVEVLDILLEGAGAFIDPWQITLARAAEIRVKFEAGALVAQDVRVLLL